MSMQKFTLAALAAASILPLAVATPADAQRYRDDDRPRYERGYDRYRGDDDGYRDRRVYRNSARRNYQDCRRSSGTTGLIAGGAGGAVLGSVLGGGTLGTVLGAVGGGLVGKKLDQNHDRAQNYRNGC